MSRNIIICLDGTNNQFGIVNTNVVRLIQVLNRDPSLQRMHYDAGVGTLPEPGFVSPIGQWASKVAGLATGSGLKRRVESAYSYLMDIWEPGDQVFLFGFSRGAYTARVLAGLLHELGLMPRGNDNLVPYAMRLFETLPSRKREAEPRANDEYWGLRNTFRWTFARPACPEVADRDEDERRFPVRFMGLWDTVSSVGWVWEPKTFVYTSSNPSVKTICHAVAIDECRCFFRQNLLRGMPGQELHQEWFPGVHADVGGGYPEADSGLWRPPFEWILQKARSAGLHVDSVRLAKVRTITEASDRPWADNPHESLRGWWHLAEYYPKQVYSFETQRTRARLGLGKSRLLRDGDRINSAALNRIREAAYTPSNMSPRFIDHVRALRVVPDYLSYSQAPT